MDRDLRAAVGQLDLRAAADLDEDRGTLRVPGLEDLDDAWQAVRDVRAGDTAGVERPHRQLGARLADRLGGDDAHRVADLAHLARRREDAVAALAHTGRGAALQNRSHLQRQIVAQLLDELGEKRRRNGRIPLGEHGLPGLARGERPVDAVGEHAPEQ